MLDESDGDASEAAPAPELGSEGGVLDAHRAFVLGIDDASRRAYTSLAAGGMIATVLILWFTGTRLLSWQALVVAPLAFLGAVLFGRFLLLARHDEALRARVRAYCREQELGLEELVGEAREQGRFEFFVKLFSGASPSLRGRNETSSG